MTEEQSAAIRRAALARRDYVLHLARALEQRADDPYYQPENEDLDRECAQALRQLVEGA